MKRTDIDFSEHEVIESLSTNAKIWTLKKLNTNIYSVTFINSCGVLAVTGDLGNWIFCREFHPSKDGKVSDYYWYEKLKISSQQDAKDFNEEETRKAIKQEAKSYLEQCEYKHDLKPDKEILNSLFNDGHIFNEQWDNFSGIDDNERKYIEWLVDCDDYCQEGAERYLYQAHDSLPEYGDHESVVAIFDINWSLQGVFDAFEEICDRMPINTIDPDKVKEHSKLAVKAGLESGR
ncbi:MAG: hypothetical protein NE330_15125 [Lentisphaeraceae bacterium]|nr:hypothetical protein [Lentisphaeraceae bacterium]